jgi:hypothetical protein
LSHADDDDDNDSDDDSDRCWRRKPPRRRRKRPASPGLVSFRPENVRSGTLALVSATSILQHRSSQSSAVCLDPDHRIVAYHYPTLSGIVAVQIVFVHSRLEEIEAGQYVLVSFTRPRLTLTVPVYADHRQVLLRHTLFIQSNVCTYM